MKTPIFPPIKIMQAPLKMEFTLEDEVAVTRALPHSMLDDPAATPSPRSGSAAFGLLRQSVFWFQRRSQVGFRANGRTGACGVDYGG